MGSLQVVLAIRDLDVGHGSFHRTLLPLDTEDMLDARLSNKKRPGRAVSEQLMAFPATHGPDPVALKATKKIGEKQVSDHATPRRATEGVQPKDPQAYLILNRTRHIELTRAPVWSGGGVGALAPSLLTLFAVFAVLATFAHFLVLLRQLR